MTGKVIVVALDGSTHALDAVPVASTLATILGATIRLVHVGPEPPNPPEALASAGLEAAQLKGRVLDTRAGEPSVEIVRAARESGASFIVMCTHTGVLRVGRPLGGTALGVLEAAPCPLVLVRPERGTRPWALRRILLPHDGTPTTSAAVGPAAVLAREAGAELVVLHVAGPRARLSDEAGAIAPPRYLDQPQHEWPAWVGEFIERLGCLCPLESVKVRMALAHGEPSKETIRFAEENGSDLIALAWRGAWAGDRAAIVKDLMRRSPCPTMVVRADR